MTFFQVREVRTIELINFLSKDEFDQRTYILKRVRKSPESRSLGKAPSCCSVTFRFTPLNLNQFWLAGQGKHWSLLKLQTLEPVKFTIVPQPKECKRMVLSPKCYVHWGITSVSQVLLGHHQGMMTLNDWRAGCLFMAVFYWPISLLAPNLEDKQDNQKFANLEENCNIQL